LGRKKRYRANDRPKYSFFFIPDKDVYKMG
jgi:hypothetical protein